SSDLDNFPTTSTTCFFGKKKAPTVIHTDPHISDVSDDDFSDGENISQTNELNNEEEVPSGLDMLVPEMINRWLLYGKDCNTARVTSKLLKEFHMELAKSLANAGKQSSRGRPSISSTNKTSAQIISNPILPRPDITT
ncbi:unnamed protein product, partial [Acanthoscelides obtectus]